MSVFLSHRPTARKAPSELLVLSQWEETAGWLFAKTSRWPRSARFPFASRVQERTLDVLELLVTARYDRGERASVLARVNLHLERLRLLLRLARSAGHLSTREHEGAMRRIDEVGRMLHGWRRREAGR